MQDPERIQRLLNEIGPARWQAIGDRHFHVEFFVNAELPEDAATQMKDKVRRVEDLLADHGAKVEGLGAPSPAIPPRKPPNEIVSYDE